MLIQADCRLPFAQVLMLLLSAFSVTTISNNTIAQECTTYGTRVFALDADDPTFDGDYGWSVAMDEGIAAIGAPGANGGDGKVYIYNPAPFAPWFPGGN